MAEEITKQETVVTGAENAGAVKEIEKVGEKTHLAGKKPKFGGKDNKRRPIADNVIFVGKKGPMNYVMAAITQMNKGEREVHVKARGKSICKAVDVVQLLKNRFETTAQIKNVLLGTEEVDAEEGGKIKVSTIDIVICK